MPRARRMLQKNNIKNTVIIKSPMQDNYAQGSLNAKPMMLCLPFYYPVISLCGYSVYDDIYKGKCHRAYHYPQKRK